MSYQDTQEKILKIGSSTNSILKLYYYYLVRVIITTLSYGQKRRVCVYESD